VSSAFAVLPKVLILGAEQSAWIADIQTKLTNTGQFSEVDYQVIPNAGGSLPTLAQLQGYASVMVFSDYSVGSGLGSILASYCDGGGGVVVCMFCLGSGIAIDASFDNSTYNVITPGSYTASSGVTLGTVSQPTHPIMKNVSSFNGGSESFRSTSTSLNGNGAVVAYWSDGNILVAVRTGVGAKGLARRVDLNMFPVSTAQYSGGWLPSTNGDILMANAMTWAAGGGAPPSELNLQPRSINFGTIPPGAPVTSCVTANSIGASNLHITNIALSGPSDFTISSIGKNVGDSILAGNSTQYCITFNPTASGTRTGTFTLTTDGRDSGTQVVNLTGNGILPAVSYSTNALFRQVATELTDTSQVQYVKISSTGLGALLINNIYFYGLNANNYFITHYPQSPLPPGAIDSIGIRFAPSIEGRPDANLVINTNTINNPSDTISLNGIGVLPRLVINNTYIPKSGTPATGTTITTVVNVSFGSVNVGADSCMFIALYNPGSDTLAIEKNFFSSADYDFSFTPLNGTDSLILPGGTTQVEVCFQPIKQGTRTATLRITTNIPHTFDVPPHDTSGFSIDITGIGVPFGHLAITGPATVPVSPVGTKLCWEDTLWNTGMAAVQVDRGAISGTDGSEFTNSGLTFPLTLQPNTFQTFDVCGNPTADSTQTALFTATGTTGGEGGIPDTITASIPLLIFGTTVCDSLHWVTNFPASTCFGTTDTGVISVTNCGNVAAQYMASISGADSAMFTVLNPTTSSSESGGGVAMFKITYTPDTVQTDVTSTAVFNIAGGANGTLQLNATRGAAIIAGTGTAPVTPVGASPVTFTVIVKNTGDCDWNPGTPVVSAPFAYVSGAATIPPNGTDTLTFTFAPTALGPFTQQVQFQNSVGVSVPWANVSVSGTAGTSSVPMVSAQNGYSIDQSYPNPNNGTSNVEITLPTAGNVHLAILDITGNVVQNVLDQQEGAGSFTVTIKANDLASGTYFYQMTSGGVTLTRQMSIVK
jgi:hypothetical protein